MGCAECGRGVVEGGADIATAFSALPFDHLLFTGSSAAGRQVAAAAATHLTPVTLELGGNDPAIVRQDADLPSAAEGIFQAAFANTGQVCAAIKRVYVHEAVFDEFVECIVRVAFEKLGDGVDVTGLDDKKMSLSEMADTFITQVIAPLVTRKKKK